MNERIQQLAHEAGLPTYNPEGIPTKLEKFAELIVRECARVADRWVEDEDNGHNLVSERLRQHFGVKE